MVRTVLVWSGIRTCRVWGQNLAFHGDEHPICFTCLSGEATSVGENNVPELAECSPTSPAAHCPGNWRHTLWWCPASPTRCGERSLERCLGRRAAPLCPVLGVWHVFLIPPQRSCANQTLVSFSPSPDTQLCVRAGDTSYQIISMKKYLYCDAHLSESPLLNWIHL